MVAAFAAGEQGHAGADRDPAVGAVGEDDRAPCDRRAQPLAGKPRPGEAGFWHQHRELLAAETAEHVAAAGDPAQLVRDRLKHGVAGRMAVSVVDRLEPVDVEQGERKRTAAAIGADHLGLHLGHQLAAVRQAGQRVRRRLFVQFPGQAERMAMRPGRARHRRHQQGDHQRADREEDLAIAVGGCIGALAGTLPLSEQAPFLHLHPSDRSKDVRDLDAVGSRLHRRRGFIGAAAVLERDQPGERGEIGVEAPAQQVEVAPLGHIVGGQRAQRPEQPAAVAAPLIIGLEEAAVAGDQIAALAAQGGIDRGLEPPGNEQDVERVDLQALGAAPLGSHLERIGHDCGEHQRDGRERAEAEESPPLRLALKLVGARDQGRLHRAPPRQAANPGR